VAALALAGIGLTAAGAVIGAAAPADPRLLAGSQDLRIFTAPSPTPVRRPEPRVAPNPAAAPQKPARRAYPKHVPRPVRIVVPAIGISAPIIPLGLNADHTMQVPASYSEAGWFRPGPEPGERGAAVIVGHVDSHNGPGVFYRLRALRRGDRFTIVLVDGRRLRFVVTSSRDVSKQHFPSGLVYARTPRPTLRLVTCGGRFNTATGHYVDNHIVFAWLIGRP
jgi:sortase (surface protein transpeptidase)